MFMKRILLVLLIIITASESFAQLTSCAQTLRLARSTYEQGRLHEIPTLLEKCIASGFSQQEKVEAYKLLCLSYIYLEEPDKADEAMLNLLRTDHYFEINPGTDPAEFIGLYRSFRTSPIYRIGAKLGINVTSPDVKSYLSANNDAESKYSPGLGFQASLIAEIPLTKKFDKLIVSPGIDFMITTFNYESTVTTTDLLTGEDVIYKTTGKESNTWMSIPVLVQYQVLKTNKLNPYVALGFSTSYMIRASNTFLRTKENRSSYDEQTIDITDQRNRLNISGLAAAGMKIKVPNGFATTQIRLAYGFSKLPKEEGLYDPFSKSIPTDGYVDGMFSINAVSFTIGYVYNVFNPKKLKR